MKKFSTLSIILSLTLALTRGTWADHEMTAVETESKARHDIEGFWKALDKAKNAKRPSTAQTHLKSARTKIKNIQRKDPGFDIAPLEAAINGVVAAEPTGSSSEKENRQR
jgi:hypothetical protein